MITREAIGDAATSYHTSDLNIAREYIQHLALNLLYRRPNADRLLFKGGTALRIVYKSPRFSEDLDFSSYMLSGSEIEQLFLGTLEDLQRQGISVDLHPKSQETSGGYYGEARCRLYDYDVRLEINVNARTGDNYGEFKLILGEFGPNYSLMMLPEQQLVREKIEALKSRRMPRDFYDLYFMLRANLVPVELRSELRDVVPLVESTETDFRQELSVYLPQDHQPIIRAFRETLLAELRRNIG